MLVNAPTLRDLLQRGIDRRAAQLLPIDYRALENAVREEERVRPRGLSLNRTTISQILKGNYRGEASDGTIRAIGWLAGVADKVAFTAAGHQPQGLPFASELPQGVDDLTAPERRAALDMLRVLVAQRQEINRNEHAEDLDPSSKPDASTEVDENEEVYDFDEFGEYGLVAGRVHDEDKPGASKKAERGKSDTRDLFVRMARLDNALDVVDDFEELKRSYARVLDTPIGRREYQGAVVTLLRDATQRLREYADNPALVRDQISQTKALINEAEALAKQAAYADLESSITEGLAADDLLNESSQLPLSGRGPRRDRAE